MLFNGNGSAGKAGGTLTVTAPAGATVTVSKEDTSLSREVGEDGKVVFWGLSSGTWKIVASNGEEEAETEEAVNTEFFAEVQFYQPFAYSYTGKSEFVGDPDGDWELHLLSDGTLTITDPGRCKGIIDLYLLGGGGGGSENTATYTANAGTMYYGGGGGGGGYATNVMDGSIQLEEGAEVKVTIGRGGNPGSTAAQAGTTKAVIGETTYSAEGGYRSNSRNGGKGGSGGGGGGVFADAGGAGGTNGGNGKGKSNSAWNVSSSGGTGSGDSTLPFEEENDIPYGCGGGGGGAYYTATGLHGDAGSNGGATANRGMGGKGKTQCGSEATAGGSGIVIIRNHRTKEA